MTRPTHRHKPTGDIVFWGEHLDPGDHEKLPRDYWKKHDAAVAATGKADALKVRREARFKGWTVEELGVYFEDQIARLSEGTKP
jgi:hypothetical protein